MTRFDDPSAAIEEADFLANFNLEVYEVFCADGFLMVEKEGYAKAHGYTIIERVYPV